MALERKEWEEVGRIKSELELMLRADAMGFVVRSRFKQNAEEEKASLYHAAKERTISSNINSLKIGGQVVTRKEDIEDEVINFFGALLNGHHDSNLVNTGVPFEPDNTFLGEFLDGLSSMDNDVSEKLHNDIGMNFTRQLGRLLRKFLSWCCSVNLIDKVLWILIQLGQQGCLPWWPESLK